MSHTCWSVFYTPFFELSKVLNQIGLSKITQDLLYLGLKYLDSLTANWVLKQGLFDKGGNEGLALSG